MTKIPLIIAILAAVIALGTFAYATDTPAMLGSEPETCASCHVMDAVYENWFHGGHQASATCSECHLPHDTIFTYYYEKGRAGMHDAYVFSFGKAPQVIRATEHTQEIIQGNCLRCHEQTVEDVVIGAQEFDRKCWDCHRSVAHGQRGISLVPLPDNVIYNK
jgi:cytochrome c nitrite reductase small subunit